ncbi:MAG TPA: sulfurtransferase-like selenium metabolism protein YedF [Spirochaetota bacterium]|nr:sulfurtransferase-like selenium metabolism protein YedF [Spirochaetota bacterium]
MKTIDARGLECPQPLLLTKSAIEDENPDELEVLVSSQTSVGNVTRFAENSGYLVQTSIKDDYFTIVLHKAMEAKPFASVKLQPSINNGKNVVVFITSNEFGRGDTELGQLLMKSFINTMNEANVCPTTIIFAHSGIFLTTEDSPVIQPLQQIEKKGVQILNCGTCLEYYKRTTLLKVGTISNMYTITETLMMADKLIQL